MNQFRLDKKQHSLTETLAKQIKTVLEYEGVKLALYYLLQLFTSSFLVKSEMEILK